MIDDLEQAYLIYLVRRIDLELAREQRDEQSPVAACEKVRRLIQCASDILDRADRELMTVVPLSAPGRARLR